MVEVTVQPLGTLGLISSTGTDCLKMCRECWCAQTLAGIAEKLDDTACNYPCEGDNTTACGGSLKLTVYRVSVASGLSSPGLLALVSTGLVMMTML